MSEIFKLQRSIASTHDGERVLAYNKKKSSVGEFPMEPYILALFGENQKIYIKARIAKDGKLIFYKFVEEQDW